MKDRIKEIVDKNVVVHIKTLEQLIELNKVVRELGITPLSNNYSTVINRGDFCVHIFSTDCMWSDRAYYIKEKYKIIEFEDLCKNNTIVIYQKGNQVIALDKRTGKKAVAKCDPRDTFNFNIGAKLAFERLTIEPKPQFLNTKICITDKPTRISDITVGKIYEIKDGRFLDDRGETYPMFFKFKDIDNVKNYFGRAKFVEVVE